MNLLSFRKLHFLYIPVFTFFAFTPNYSLAQTRDIDEVALSILTQSPGYRAGDLSLESALTANESGVNLPDPELEGEFLAAPKGETDRWGAELSWSLEWPGVYNARKNEVKREAKSLELTLNMERREQLLQIKSLLLDYILIEKKLAILHRLTQANDSITNFALSAFKGGEITRLDLNKIRIDNALLNAHKSSLTDEKNALSAELSVIFGSDCNALLSQLTCEFPGIVIPENISEEIINSSPQVLLADTQRETALANSKVVRMEALPGISFGYKHAYEDGAHFNGATLGISLPIFSNRHKKKAATAALNEADYNLELARLNVSNDFNLTSSRLQKMVTQINELKPVIESEDNIALLTKAYENGIISIIDYITERNYFLEALQDLLDLEHSASKTFLSLQKYSL